MMGPQLLKALIVLTSVLTCRARSGDLRVADRVSWSSLRNFRNSNGYCEDEYDIYQNNKKWDFCSHVSADLFGGDYKKESLSSPNEIAKQESKLFALRNCFCDKECGRFGDCCLDAAIQASYDGTDEEQDRWSCVKLPGAFINSVNAIYTVGKCSDSWHSSTDYAHEGRHTKARCLMDPSVGLHYTQYLPVLSKTTNITYRNVYCAICNGDLDLQDWNLVVSCSKKVPDSELISGTYLTDENFYPFFQHWQFVYNNKDVRCRLHVKEFENGYKYAEKYGARACKPAIDHCHPDWPDAKDKERCRMYASYMYREWDSSMDNVTVYKNYHCAKCNFVQMDRLVCLSHEVILGVLPHQSLSILFDFNMGSGAVVGKKEDGCSPGEIFDHLRKRCLAVHCGRLYKFVNGKCQPDENSKFFNNSLTSDCQTVTLVPGEYSILTDQTVYVNLTDRTYGPGEYELTESNNYSSAELRICKEDHYQQMFKFSRVQGILSDTCLYISIVCLMLQIVSYTLVPKLRNLPGKNLLSLSCSLLVGQLIFLFGIHRNEIQFLCSTLAVAMHFFFLAYFFWMNVMAIDVCRTFGSDTYRPSSGSRTFLRYSCYAWWTPTILVTVAIIVDNVQQVDPSFRPGYGKEMCWITQKKALMVFFALPVAVITLINIVMFSLTVWHIKKSDDISRRATKRSDKIRLFLYVKLALIMGLTWLLGFIAALADSQVLFYPFVVFNGLQGAFIFLAFSCKRKVFVLVSESVRGTSLSQVSSGAKTKKDSRSTTVSTNITTNSFKSTSNGSEKTRRISNIEVAIQNRSSKDPNTVTRIKKRSSNNLKVPNPNESDV